MNWILLVVSVNNIIANKSKTIKLIHVLTKTNIPYNVSCSIAALPKESKAEKNGWTNKIIVPAQTEHITLYIRLST